MPKPDKTGVAHLVAATGYALQGLRTAFLREEAFRQELLVLSIMVPLALWLGDSGIEYALLIGSLLLVLIIELLNSAIEAVVDRISPEFHTLSGHAKDIGSAAVFVTLVNAALIWFFVLFV